MSFSLWNVKKLWKTNFLNHPQPYCELTCRGRDRICRQKMSEEEKSGEWCRIPSCPLTPDLNPQHSQFLGGWDTLECPLTGWVIVNKLCLLYGKSSNSWKWPLSKPSTCACFLLFCLYILFTSGFSPRAAFFFVFKIRKKIIKQWVCFCLFFFGL